MAGLRLASSSGPGLWTLITQGSARGSQARRGSSAGPGSWKTRWTVPRAWPSARLDLDGKALVVGGPEVGPEWDGVADQLERQDGILDVAVGQARENPRHHGHGRLLLAEPVERSLGAERGVAPLLRVVGLLDQVADLGEPLDPKVAVPPRDALDRQGTVDDRGHIDQPAFEQEFRRVVDIQHRRTISRNRWTGSEEQSPASSHRIPASMVQQHGAFVQFGGTVALVFTCMNGWPVATGGLHGGSM